VFPTPLYASAKINISYSILFNLTTSYSSYFGGKKGISRNKTSFVLLMWEHAPLWRQPQERDLARNAWQTFTTWPRWHPNTSHMWQSSWVSPNLMYWSNSSSQCRHIVIICNHGNQKLFITCQEPHNVIHHQDKLHLHEPKLPRHNCARC